MADTATPNSPAGDAHVDRVMPSDQWAFDATVTDVFDDMLARSIPQYDVMRQMVTDLAAKGLRPGDSILDIGCSRAQALRRVLAHPDCPPHVDALGLEVSEPMVAAAIQETADDDRVMIRHRDIRQGLNVGQGRFGVVLAVLTVLFVPIQYRLRILADAHRALRPGGSLLLVEKVLGGSADIDDHLTDLYYSLKAENGYTQEQIDAKKHSLEGVQVPITAAWNEDNLRRAGFVEFDCVWRWGPFAAWWARKEDR